MIVVDFYNRLWKGREVRTMVRSAAVDREQVLVSRIATVVTGLLGTMLALNVSAIGSLLEINAKLPPRDVLLAQLAGALEAPMAQLAYVLQAKLYEMAGLLDALRASREPAEGSPESA